MERGEVGWGKSQRKTEGPEVHPAAPCPARATYWDGQVIMAHWGGERWRREHSESILLEPLWWQLNTFVLRIDLHGHFLFQTELETPWGQETMLWPWTFPVHSSVDSTLHALNTNICSNVPFSEKPFWTHPNLQSPDSKWEGTLSFLLLYPLCLKQET